MNNLRNNMYLFILLADFFVLQVQFELRWNMFGGLLIQRQQFFTRLCINRFNTHWFWRYHLRGVVGGFNQSMCLSLMLTRRSIWCTSVRILLHMVVICLHHILLLYHWIILLLKVISGKIVLEVLKNVVMRVILTCLELLLVSKLILIHHHFLGALVLQLVGEGLGVEQLEPFHPLEAGEVLTFLDHLVCSLNLNIGIIFHFLLFVLGDLGPIFLNERWFHSRLRPRPFPSAQSLLGRWSHCCHLLVSITSTTNRLVLLLAGLQHVLQLLIILIEIPGDFHRLFVQTWTWGWYGLVIASFPSTESNAIFYAINFALVMLQMWRVESLFPVLDFQLLRINLPISTTSAWGIETLLISCSWVDLAKVDA